MIRQKNKIITLISFYLCHISFNQAFHIPYQLHKPTKLFATKQSPITTTTSTPSKSHELMNKLMNWFQGELDNHLQVKQERMDDKEPPIGHEHIHCTLVPIPIPSHLHDYLLSDVAFEEHSRFLLAVYYLNGNPSTIFRSRLYHAFPEMDLVRCRIYDLHPDIKDLLKEKALDAPWTWHQNISEIIQSSQKDYFTELKKCDVLWSHDIHPTRHAYLPSSTTNAIHAIMEEEEVLKPSVYDPNKMLLIRDELSLWEDALWINDRGYDASTGELAYGNALSVPYKLSRVCSFCGEGRDVLRDDLLWTLGGRYDI